MGIVGASLVLTHPPASPSKQLVAGSTPAGAATFSYGNPPSGVAQAPHPTVKTEP